MKARAASLSLGRADALRHPVVLNERLGETVEMGRVDIWIEIFGLANNCSLATAHLTPQSSVSLSQSPIPTARTCSFIAECSGIIGTHVANG